VDKRALMLLVVVSTCLFVGCAGYDPYRSPWDNLFSPAPRTYYSASRERHRRREHQLVVRKRSAAFKSTATTASEDVPPYTGRATPATAAASNPPASLSLVGDGGDRVRAQRLLAAVDNKLVRVHAQDLKGSQKDTYERARQLAYGAHRALADDDCAAAASLAAKASSLAADIAEP